jgi:hypothetical protein
MRVYQLSYRDQKEGHQGYGYFTSKAAAKKDATRAKRNGCETTELVLWVEISKAGILRALNTYGGHPDNG